MTEFLFLLFSLAFIVTPLWSIGTNVYYQTFLMFGLVVSGWFWAKLASTTIQITIPQKGFWFLLICFVLIVFINFKPISNNISYLGDEIHHLIKPFMVNKMVGAPILFFGTVIFGAIYFSLYKKINGLTLYLSGVLILSSVILFSFFFDESLRETFEMYLVRFPFLPTLLSSIMASITGTFGGVYHEFSYRLVPLICIFLTGVYCTIQFFGNRSALKRVLVFASIISIPSVYYYSSILYLEPLILLLTTVILVNINALLAKDLKSKKVENLGWICLLLLGFIKETVVPILVGFLFIRGIKWIFEKNYSFQSFWEEVQIAFSLLLPLAIYLWFRGDVRGFNFDPSGAFDLSIYKLFFITIWEQFGLVLPIAAIAFLFLKSIGTWERIFISVTTVITFVFYLLDFGGIFIGYSRFNLFFAPFILVLFCKGIFEIKNEWVANIALAGIICTNLYLSPINVDGSRYLNWERCIDCVNMSVDMVYPINEALNWASSNLKKEDYQIHILKPRKYYYPYKEFYLKKYQWKPSIDFGVIDSEYFKIQLANLLEKPTDKKRAIIVQPPKNWELPKALSPSQNFELKTFTNQTLPIYILFEK